MSIFIAENIFFVHECTFILSRVYWIIMQQIYFFLEKFYPACPFSIMQIFDLKYWPTIPTQLFRISVGLSFWHTVVQKYVLGLNDSLTIRFLAGVKRERRKVLVSSKMTNFTGLKIQVLHISLFELINTHLVMAKDPKKTCVHVLKTNIKEYVSI